MNGKETKRACGGTAIVDMLETLALNLLYEKTNSINPVPSRCRKQYSH
ncbi:MAG TPA: hypothetical protein VJC20_00810 [Candidatus Paceibacterota bacterium]